MFMFKNMSENFIINIKDFKKIEIFLVLLFLISFKEI